MYLYSSLYNLVDTTVDNIDSAVVVAVVDSTVEWVVVGTVVDTFVVAVDTSPVDFVVADDRRGSRAREAAAAVVAAVASSDASVRSS